MMKNKICFILNYPPHYRYFIFKKINENINADFYFGDIPNSSIKKINYSQLTNFKKEFKTLKFKSFYWYKRSWILAFKPYNQFVLTGDPQIVSNWIILILARLLGKKTYLWTHGWYGKETRIKKIIKKAYFGLANKIFLYGEYAKELMVNEGFNSDKLIPIYNSLNYDQQLEIRNNLTKSSIYQEHFRNNNPVIIYIGRIQKVKRLDQILEALYILNEEKKYVNLVIVGEKSNAEDLEEQIEKYNLTRQVWFFGSSYDEKKNGELIYNSALCVSPGNVGLTAIHCLMYGTPVITHDNFSTQMPEFETIFENYTGAFFKENDIDDLALKIVELLNKKLDPLNCHKVIDNKWNPNNQINILKNTLNNLNR